MDFKAFGGLGGLLQQAGRFREDMARLQEGLAKKTVEASAGGGMVKVVANGKQQIVSVVIDPQIWKMNDPQMLQDLVVAAVNQALKQAQDMVADEMKKLTGGLGPLLDMLKGSQP